MNCTEFILFRLMAFREALQPITLVSSMLSALFVTSYIFISQDDVFSKSEVKTMKSFAILSLLFLFLSIVLYIFIPTKEEYESLFGKDGNRTVEVGAEAAD